MVKNKNKKHTFNVKIDKNGRQVNIMTRRGANAFLESSVGRRASDTSPGYVIADLRLIHLARANLDKHNLPDVNKAIAEFELNELYNKFTLLAGNADPHIFETALNPASGSSPNQFMAYWNHVESVLKTLCGDILWRTTGKLKSYNLTLLHSMIPHCFHQSSCRLLLDKTTLLNTMAIFLGNCENPSSEVCEPLVQMLRVVIGVKERSLVDICKRFCKTGMLVQALRCYAYIRSSDRARFAAELLDCLTQSYGILSKNLRLGTPAGDVLAALVARKDIPSSIHNRLQNLHRLAANTTSDSRTKKLSCCNCGKSDDGFQSSYQKCERCRAVFYCNRECQRADWKSHKKVCKPYDREHDRTSKCAETCMNSFLMENYAKIMWRLTKLTKEHKRKDLVVVIDFFADENGVAPALKSPPEHDFFLISRGLNSCLNGGGFLRGRDRARLQQKAEHVAANQLLVLGRWCDGKTATSIFPTHSGSQIFSDEAISAFSLAMKGDRSQLSAILSGNCE